VMSIDLPVNIISPKVLRTGRSRDCDAPSSRGIQ
jgi:hypothetical protein